jgi:hypothetical protein
MGNLRIRGLVFMRLIGHDNGPERLSVLAVGEAEFVVAHGLVIGDDQLIALNLIQLKDGPSHNLLPCCRIFPAIGLEHRAVKWQYIAEHVAVIGKELLHLFFPGFRLQQNQRSDDQDGAEGRLRAGEIGEQS